MKTRRRVALFIETSNSYGRGLLRGINTYVKEHGLWSTFLPEQESGEQSGHFWLGGNWTGEGILARVETRETAQMLASAALPIVNVSTTNLLPEAPKLIPDEEAIAELAVNHFVERGFKHFAFSGDRRFNWSDCRGEHFTRLVEKIGGTCSENEVGLVRENGASLWEQEQRKVAEWIRRLPKPVGILACHDFRGWQILEVCRAIGVAVPDEVAVIGVDNDELLCELSDPPLSSIMLDHCRTGYEAASLLDRWMAGKPPQKGLVKSIKPLGVATRKSTDVLAIADPEITKAVRYIREHACDGIRVENVLKVVPLSRRVLEHRFKKLLGHTPHEEILRLQFQRVVQLLCETDLPLAAISERAGFRHPEYMSVAFKARFGVPPSQYRQRCRELGESRT
jgi:LacI family transcriptional regulator